MIVKKTARVLEEGYLARVELEKSKKKNADLELVVKDQKSQLVEMDELIKELQDD